MKLKEWEIDELFGPFEKGTAEECYEQSVKSAQGGSVYSAALLLQAASTYISKGKSMPKPLADYMVTILTQVESEASKNTDVTKRARKIVKALNLKTDRRKRKMTKRESNRKSKAQLAQLYMCKQIEFSGMSKYAAAKKAAKKFPEAVKSSPTATKEISDSRVKAYTMLYSRRPDNLKNMLDAILLLNGEIVEVIEEGKHAKKSTKENCS